MKPFNLLAGCGLLLALSCQLNNRSDSLNSANLTDSISVYQLEEPKLIKKAGIHIQVKDVQGSARSITELTRSLGGMITYQQIESGDENEKRLKISDDSLLVVTAYTTRASITARVPQE